MRQRQKHHIMISKYLLGRLFDQPIEQRKVRVMLAEECAGIGVGGDCADLNAGMGKQQAEQLSPCITGGTCHRRPYSHSHEYATTDKLMHFRLMTRSRCGDQTAAPSEPSNLIAQSERQSRLPLVHVRYLRRIAEVFLEAATPLVAVGVPFHIALGRPVQ